MEEATLNPTSRTNTPRLAAAATDVGCVREHNEDSHGMIEALGLYVVCDGMGGAAGGEVASQMAVEAFLEFVRGRALAIHLEDRQERAQVLQDAVLFANRAVYSRAQDEPTLRGMGATLVCAWFFGRDVLFANVGDSRAYLIRGASIKQLTDDHSLLAEQVRQGNMTEAEAAASPMGSVITRALGTREVVEPDFFLLETQTEDRVLLTTDGLLRHVADDEILSTVRRGTPLEACCRLVALAHAGGGSDNTTCVLVQA